MVLRAGAKPIDQSRRRIIFTSGRDPNEMKEFEQPNTESMGAGEKVARLNPPWRAKTVWLAALLVILGSYFWVKDAASTTPSHTASAGKTGLAADGSGAGDKQVSR